MKLDSIMDQLHVLKIQMLACKHNTFLVCKILVKFSHVCLSLKCDLIFLTYFKANIDFAV